MISFKTREPFEQFFSSSALHKLFVLIFCSSEGNYFAAENEYNAVDMNISIADDEATLTMVDDPFLSVCEIPLSGQPVQSAWHSTLEASQCTEIPV